MLAYIWNTQGKYPDEVFQKPGPVKLFIYEATRRRQEAERPKGGSKSKRK